MKITVVGTGYVGLVTGTCLADMGNDVVCVDVDEAKVDTLRGGELPIYEPGLGDLVKRATGNGRLSFTTSLGDALPGSDVCFIAVGTPPNEDGSADRRHVMSAATQIAQAAVDDLVVAVKSTVPVGTCDMVQQAIDDELGKIEKNIIIRVVSNPEFLKEGKAVNDFMRPDRIVVGANDDSARAVMQGLYKPFVRNGHPVILMAIRSSELTKYVANAMLATRISMMNEVAQLCDHIGADIMDVRRGVGTDRRIGMDFLYAGIGYGGSCFPKDVRALARVAVESDSSAHILDAVESVNRHQKLWLANRLLQYWGGSARGKKIAVWGLAFKANTDDIRESSALSIIGRLTEAGGDICAFDPEAMDNAKLLLSGNDKVSFASGMYDAATDADAVVLATEWGIFRSLDFARLKEKMRTQYEPREVREQGFEYFGIGRGGEHQ